MVALKRREKMACQRSMTQKKGEKKGVTFLKKKERDKDDSREKSHYLKE